MALSPVTLREKLASVPVVKSGLSLMTGTMLTSLLGLVFWFIAANLYEPADFGINATAIYTMMMLADLACLGLRMGVVRFLPRAGERTARTIIVSYALVIGASAVTGVVFLAGLHLWAPRLLELRSSILLFVFFVCSTSFWSLFMMQDGVLVGLRKAPWVPIENTLFGILKILLLFPFAAWSPTLGIFWAWTLPVFPIVFGITAMIAKVVPTHAAETTADDPSSAPPPLMGEILSFSLADWVSSVARLAALGVIPLMVLAASDETENAFFQAGWLIGLAVFMLSTNAAYALLAENSYEQHKLRRNSMQAVYLSLALTVPIIIVGGLGAPILLGIFYGSEYAANSTWILRLLLLAALPNAIYQIFTGRLRSESKMAAVVVIETVLAVLVVSMVWLFLPRFGIEGVGLAWIIGLTITATYAVINESQWWWLSRVDTRLVRGAGSIVRRVRGTRPARGLDERLTRAIPAVKQAGSTVRWTAGDDDVQTAIVNLADGRALEVDFARSAAGAAELDRLRSSLTSLGGDARLTEIQDVLPRLEARDYTQGAEFSAWWAPVGATGLELVEAGAAVAPIAEAALSKLRPLHEATANTVVVDEDLIDSWLAGPMEYLATTGRASVESVQEVRRRLVAGFVGTTTELGQIHGGLSLSNIVVDPVTDPVEVVGFARWERTASDLPADVDRAMLTISDLCRRQSGELGQVVRSLLADPHEFTSHPIMEGRASTEASTSRGGSLALILLAWLHFVGRPLPQRTVNGEAFWLARNAQPVLAALESRSEMRS